MSPTSYNVPPPPTTQDTVPGALDEVKHRMDIMEEELRELKFDMMENTRATQAVVENTSAIVELMQNAKGAWNIMEGLAKVAKVIAIILAFCALILAAIKGWFVTHTDIGGGQ